MVPRRRETGAALLMLMVAVVIATILGLWALESSRTGVLQSGHQAAQTKLQLLADQGLQKGLRRIQEIANAEGNLPEPSDSIGKEHTREKTAAWLLCQPQEEATPRCLCAPPEDGSAPGCATPACNDSFGTKVGWDDVSENVVCNLLGTTLRDTQVMLARKADVTVTDSETNAVFLLTSIARDSEDRRQITQGVVVVPYQTATGIVLAEPYLATSSQGGD